MVRITEELVRKKSEHNELLISTLEELSLHQEDIEKIEHLQNWCRDLKILYLQSNLIARIENLHKLKKLEYLNLAVNNIEKFENLEQLESLHKLDLTLNFIGDLQSCKNLINNYNLRELNLVGNPCTDYPNYRNYVIVTLPQLDSLDCEEIKISDKIQAKQIQNESQMEIVQAEVEYRIKRDEQKIRVEQNKMKIEYEMEQLETDEERTKFFWNTKSENCPETRIDIVKQQRKGRGLDIKPEIKIIPEIKFFASCGRPYNMNQPKFKFNLSDLPDRYELDVKLYKFMDTMLFDVDIQPNYVRVSVKKKKHFQLSLADEIKCNESTSKRSLATGNLFIFMPKLKCNGEIVLDKKVEGSTKCNSTKSETNSSNLKGTVNYKNIIKPTEKQLTSFSSKKTLGNIEIPDLI